MRLKETLMDLSKHLDEEELFDLSEPGTAKYGAAPGLVADPVNSPPHYTNIPGIEAIQVTEHFNFNCGNALKYILRHEHKGAPEQDLEKAIWYLRRELHRRKMVRAMDAKP